MTRIPAACCALCACALSACIVVDTDYDKVPPGVYRGVFYLDGRLSERVEPDDIAADFQLDDVPQGELPVNFEVGYRPDSSLRFTFVNGDERIEASRVEFERLFESARDSLTVHFPLNDAYLTAYHEEGTIEGAYVDLSRGSDYRIPFTGFHGVSYRFTELEKQPAADLSGRWATTFGVEPGAEPYAAVGEFEQSGNRLRGTFLTATGDYRYLDGTIQGERFYLSTFDGGHVFLFAGKLVGDSLLGIFRSGNHYQTIWTAGRDADARLPDASAETVVTDGGPVAVLGFDPRTGRRVSVLDRPEVAGKYKVLSLMGSWCPNCRDEAVYLDSLLATLPRDRVAVVGLAYERMRDTSRALSAVERFRENLDISYPIVLAGSSDKAEATSGLGFVEEVKSFPTMLVLTPDNRVVYTHTGFTGPATSQYGQFAREFSDTLRQIIAR